MEEEERGREIENVTGFNNSNKPRVYKVSQHFASAKYVKASGRVEEELVVFIRHEPLSARTYREKRTRKRKASKHGATGYK